MLINQFLLLGAFLFATGVYGVLARKNAVLVLMSIELILNAVNLNLIAFALNNGSDVNGMVFALFVIAIAAAEVGVGLAMVLLIYRNRHSIALSELDAMKG
jgi:NADH:ubiquinone oxidoreductase subunit K